MVGPAAAGDLVRVVCLSTNSALSVPLACHTVVDAPRGEFQSPAATAGGADVVVSVPASVAARNRDAHRHKPLHGR